MRDEKHLRAAFRCSVLVVALLMSGCNPGDDKRIEPANADGVELERRISDARTRLSQNDGGRLILEAIEAHGGLRAWYEAPTSSYTWEYANVGADMQFESYLVADNTSRRIYHDLLSSGPYGDPAPVEARFAWDGRDVWIYPDTVEAINPRFWATSGYYFEQIPFVFADPGLNYEVLPDDSLNGRPNRLVRISFEPGVGDSPGDTYVAYVDDETRMINAVRYTVTYGRPPSADAPERETLFEYDDYVTVDGLTVPTRFRGYTFSDGEKGAFRNEAWADSISFRRPFDADRLTPPEGARFVPLPGE